MMRSLLVLCAACASKRPPEATFGRATGWDIAVLAATGDREIEAHYELVTERVNSSVFYVSTARTHGQWREPGDSSAFDSAAPTPSDPWPLTLQHLVASVPAKIRIEEGRPVTILDESEWADAAERAIYGSSLPTDAIPAGAALIDAKGLLADLARTFPGTPSLRLWKRDERVAGVDAAITEECRYTVSEGTSSWSCVGEAKEHDGEDAQLFEVKTYTEMEVDSKGLRLVETGYSGTLVTLSKTNTTVDDRPITGFRRVVRR